MRDPLACALLALSLLAGCGPDPGPLRHVAVARGTVVRQAVAVGRVEPRFEVPVTTPGSGVVTQRFVTLGQRVERDDPLVEVRPVLTDAGRLAAERALQAAIEGEATALELRQGQNLMGRLMLFMQGQASLQRMTEGAARARSGAEEALELLRTGRVDIDGHVIDYVVRAPIAGHVIQLDVEQGEPVVPASSFGSGTVLAVLADMAHPVFRGTVDEFDVGRLREGMAATVEIGALPGSALTATLSEIALRATQRANASVFAVELEVTPSSDLVLRAGYSAVARIALERAHDVLVLPERVVEYRGGEAFVLVDDGAGGAREQRVEVGVSDGLAVEVRAGLTLGEPVRER